MTSARSWALLALIALSGCAGVPASSPSGRPVVTAQQADRAAAVGASMIGRPYRYAGHTPAGFDCSGLVSYSYASAGVELPRDTAGLFQDSVPIRAGRMRRGDLVFFDADGKKRSHVGIFLGDGEFVHAPSTGGKVRKDSLDAEYWRAHFVGARRI